MTRQELISLIRERRSFLCVGLDTDPAKMPAHLRDRQDGVFLFNRAIIDAPYSGSSCHNVFPYKIDSSDFADLKTRFLSHANRRLLMIQKMNYIITYTIVYLSIEFWSTIFLKILEKFTIKIEISQLYNRDFWKI